MLDTTFTLKFVRRLLEDSRQLEITLPCASFNASKV